MAMTPNSAHSPHVAGSGDANPAVLNLRRPAPTMTASASKQQEGDVVMAAAVEEPPPRLPPTALRLPNLATVGQGSPSQVAKVLSILHWVGIGLGALIALFLIFHGQGGPPEDLGKSETQPAAKTESPSDWQAPPLPSAGDSQAPKWTPPALAPEAGEAPRFEPAPAPAPPKDSHEPESASEAPAFESWPKQDAAEEPSTSPEMPALEQASNTAPTPPNPAGPVVRTAQREMPSYEPLNSSRTGSAEGEDVQPLGITVPVPQ